MARTVTLTLDGTIRTSSNRRGDSAVLALLLNARKADRITEKEYIDATYRLGVSRSDREFFEELARENPRLEFSAAPLIDPASRRD